MSSSSPSAGSEQTTTSNWCPDIVISTDNVESTWNNTPSNDNRSGGDNFLQVGAATAHNGLSRESSRDDIASIDVGDPMFEYEERFRVDRRKLELMILQKLDSIDITASDFFHRIEFETNTTIIWPSRLKIGAKSKKDPHIRVGGTEKCVKEAKSKIMEYLDNKTNRVTMKMDVSYTDHSHVIGKGGNTIRRVMAETNCHIHFPDSNRSNPNEKSNQVSIAGEVEGVERARARVRELTPLVFNFDLPIIPSLQSTPDPLDPYLRAIQDQYNIQVMFRQKQKNFHTTTVVVKGCEWEGSRVKEATLLLIDHFCQTSSNIPVAMNMEISPQHHSIVLGKGNMTLKVIMQRTNTTILFPDAGDPNIPPIRKGSVTITGAIHNVYLARQQLVGSLPLVMMFDLPENLSSIDDAIIRKLQDENDVNISIKPKARQNNKAVIIKAQERNASGIYKTRVELLNLQDLEPLIAVIPETYKIPQGPSRTGATPSDPPINLPVNHRSPFNPHLIVSKTSEIVSPTTNPILDDGSFHNHYVAPPMMDQQPSNLAAISPFITGGCYSEKASSYHHHHPMSLPPSTNMMHGKQPSFIKPQSSSTNHHSVHHMPPQSSNNSFIHGMTPNHPFLQEYAMLVLSNISRLQQKQNDTKRPFDPLWGPASSSSSSKDERLDLNGGYMTDIGSSTSESPPHNSSPRDSTSSSYGLIESMMRGLPSSSSGNNNIVSGSHHEDISNTGRLEDMDRRAPGCEIKSKGGQDTPERGVSTTVTTHGGTTCTTTWPTGLGFSSVMNESGKSSSSSSTTNNGVNRKGGDEGSATRLDNSIELSSGSSTLDTEEFKMGSSWGESMQFMNTGLVDFNGNHQILSADSGGLLSILTNEGLNKYIDVFLRHEIDLRTFSTLTENDLKEIGITPFGARKRLLLVSGKIKKALNVAAAGARADNWI